ncbi:hypothetical protein IT570_01830 [Candidatus Sumerlaeota bacterium]|nr:hypothetical protein [Candidatus Sumerlaeota bacterium]
MTPKSAKRTLAEKILIFCGVVLILVIITYAWQVTQPTGFDKLPRDPAFDQKDPAKGSSMRVVTNTSAVGTTTTQTQVAQPIPSDADHAVSPILVAPPPFHLPVPASFVMLRRIVPSQQFWLRYVVRSSKIEGTAPDAYLTYARERFIYNLNARDRYHFSSTEHAAIRTWLDEAEKFYWSKPWPDVTAKDYFKKVGNLEDVFGDRAAAITSINKALQGDRDDANARLLVLAEQSLRLRQVSLGSAGNEMGTYLSIMDALDALTTDTLAGVIELMDEGRMTREQFTERRRVNIRAATETVMEDMPRWIPGIDMRTYILGGVPDRWVRTMMLPVVKTSLEKYAVALADRDVAEQQLLWKELNIKFRMMNVQPRLGSLGIFQWPNYYDTVFPMSAAGGELVSADPLETEYHLATRAYWPQRFLLACLRYKQDHGDWPHSMEQVTPNYLPPGFVRESGSEWFFLAPCVLEVAKSTSDRKNPVLLYFQAHDAFPTNARQLANFMQMPDDEPLRGYFQVLEIGFAFVQVRHHPIYEKNGVRYYDQGGADDKLMDVKLPGAKRLPEDMLSVTLFVFPPGAWARGFLESLCLGDGQDESQTP